MIKNSYLSFILFFWLLPSLAGNDLYPFDSNAQKDQFTKLTQEVRCLVCQNQAISESNAPLAADLRAEIYHLILQNKSSEDIKHHLTNRYGDYVLLEPAMNKHTWLLWGSPVLLLIIGIIVLSRTVRKSV